MHQQSRLHLLQLCAELAHVQTRIEQHRDRAAGDYAQHQQRIFRSTAAQDGNAFTRLHPRADEILRDAANGSRHPGRPVLAPRVTGARLDDRALAKSRECVDQVPAGRKSKRHQREVKTWVRSPTVLTCVRSTWFTMTSSCSCRVITSSTSRN